MATLRCTVRGCGLALGRVGRRWACEKGHSFDIARAGFVNLLQPQDKKAAAPGDSAEVVAARRRLLDAGVARPLTALLQDLLKDLPGGGAILDVGCGEGSHLAALCGDAAREGWGVDLSTPAIEAAARRHRALGWVVANADRGLPFLDAGFAAVLSITGRRDGAEMARVLADGGRAIIAVPADDDLAELRAAVQGAAHSLDRLEKVAGELQPQLRLAREEVVSHRIPLSPELLRDVLATTYRGARHKERAKAEALETMDVTFSWRVGVFRARQPATTR